LVTSSQHHAPGLAPKRTCRLWSERISKSDEIADKSDGSAAEKREFANSTETPHEKLRLATTKRAARQTEKGKAVVVRIPESATNQASTTNLNQPNNKRTNQQTKRTNQPTNQNERTNEPTNQPTNEAPVPAVKRFSILRTVASNRAFFSLQCSVLSVQCSVFSVQFHHE